MLRGRLPARHMKKAKDFLILKVMLHPSLLRILSKMLSLVTRCKMRFDPMTHQPQSRACQAAIPLILPPISSLEHRI
ncbi:hypothetical protein MA16_Dca001758 [Dendrobium catenatum]|uniref:Uncharacterized protein n=1 Tax=Dendrobium catenatum TaxID=906689 RepID=A0A2I0XDC6_9ASPA|nr:hypothetical protein MA16_Dca001758 [Dendrobium catenatum]